MNRKPAISIRTLGCKLNQAESESLAREFAGAGYNLTSGEDADVFVLNTCSVTQTADRKARQQLRALRKLNPQALIVVTGCYAEWAGAALKKYGADIVVGNIEKASLPHILEDSFDKILNKTAPAAERRERTRSLVKIQDGCRYFCSYCIVPLLRRDIYARDMDMVVNEIEVRVNEGYREVVLTGTEIGSYSDEAVGLDSLIARILNQTGIERLHLSSLQPPHIADSLLDLWRDERLVRHFHLALQSGSDTVLKRMKRRYDTRSFESAVNKIRGIVPDASVTTDVMVGFPGETDEEFQESYEFCDRMAFAAMHVFAYSPRPGTAAATMPSRVSGKIKKERSQRILGLAARRAEDFAKSFIGQARPVLWENEVKPDSGIYLGLTNNYIRVYASCAHDITNIISTADLLTSVSVMPGAAVRASTKGNYGELWGELNENKGESHAALVKGGSGQTG